MFIELTQQSRLWEGISLPSIPMDSIRVCVANKRHNRYKSFNYEGNTIRRFGGVT